MFDLGIQAKLRSIHAPTYAQNYLLSEEERNTVQDILNGIPRNVSWSSPNELSEQTASLALEQSGFLGRAEDHVLGELSSIRRTGDANWEVDYKIEDAPHGKLNPGFLSVNPKLQYHLNQEQRILSVTPSLDMFWIPHGKEEHFDFTFRTRDPLYFLIPEYFAHKKDKVLLDVNGGIHSGFTFAPISSGAYAIPEIYHLTSNINQSDVDRIGMLAKFAYCQDDGWRGMKRAHSERSYEFLNTLEEELKARFNAEVSGLVRRVDKLERKPFTIPHARALEHQHIDNSVI